MRQRSWLIGFASGSLTVALVSAVVTEFFLVTRVPIVGDLIGLQKSHNIGIAFGIGLGAWQTVFIVSALALVAVAAWQSAHTHWEQAGFGLIVGGGLANLLDRLMDGYVTDMIQIGSFPVFNLADVCINIGVALLLLGVVKNKMTTGK